MAVERDNAEARAASARLGECAGAFYAAARRSGMGVFGAVTATVAFVSATMNNATKLGTNLTMTAVAVPGVSKVN